MNSGAGDRLARHKPQLAGGDGGVQCLQERGRCLQLRAAVQQGDRAALRAQRQRPAQGVFVAAEYQHRTLRAGRQGGRVVVHLGSGVGQAIGQGEGAWNKGPDPGGDEHGFCQVVGAIRCPERKASVGLAFQAFDQGAQVKAGLHGRDLRLQALHQFPAGAHTEGGDVVNRFVSVEFDALAAHIGQGIDHMGAHAVQAKLKDLEQTHRPGTDDQGVGGGGFQLRAC